MAIEVRLCGSANVNIAVGVIIGFIFGMLLCRPCWGLYMNLR